MLHEIASRMFNTPLMLHPGKAAVIAEAVGPRVLGGSINVSVPDQQMGLLGNPMLQKEAEYVEPDMTGNVAMIPIEGTLVAKGKWVKAYSGETSYEGIQAQVAHARGNATVKAAAFEVDSFGGEVTGAFSCADAIFELSREKPTIAILTDHACSAGYLLASACRAVIVPKNGYVGSIGVIALHVAYPRALEEAGIDVTILAAGAHKADFNPYEALPKDVADRFRAEIEAERQMFAEAVGRYRGDRLTKDAALATEAQTFLGADAVKAGLADAVADPMKAFDAFVEEMATA